MKNSEFNLSFMQRAIVLAKQAYEIKEIPVGAVIVNRSTRKIIAESHNLTENSSNALNHAEMLAIASASSMLQSKYLFDCDIYVTLEPCIMCAAAISYAKLGRLFYGAPDKKCGSVENGVRYFTTKSCFYRPEIYIGFLSSESESLMSSFFSNLRKNTL